MPSSAGIVPLNLFGRDTSLGGWLGCPARPGSTRLDRCPRDSAIEGWSGCPARPGLSRSDRCSRDSALGGGQVAQLGRDCPAQPVKAEIQPLDPVVGIGRHPVPLIQCRAVFQFLLLVQPGPSVESYRAVSTARSASGLRMAGGSVVKIGPSICSRLWRLADHMKSSLIRR